MKNYHFVFEKIQALLNRHFREQLNVDLEEYDDGYSETHLSIGGTDIWISYDNKAITVGRGLSHKHYYPELDELNDLADDLMNLLTQRRRITEYYKGKTCYKIKTEEELVNGGFKTEGTTMWWFFPFWKPIKKKVSYQDRLVKPAEIRVEINEIKNIDKLP